MTVWSMMLPPLLIVLKDAPPPPTICEANGNEKNLLRHRKVYQAIHYLLGEMNSVPTADLVTPKNPDDTVRALPRKALDALEVRKL